MKIKFLVGSLEYFNSYAFIYPIYNGINFLNEEYTISIDYKTDNKKYDIIFVDSKYFYKSFITNNFENISQSLIKEKQKCHVLAYFDNEASLYINHKIYDYVDFYLKSKLPKDINYYKKKYYGLRSYTDFYYTNFNVKDNNEKYSQTIEDSNTKKNILGWNNGICDYSLYSNIKRKLFSYSKIKYLLNFKLKYIKKTNKISARISQSYDRETISFQRKYILKNFEDKFKTERLKKIDYFKELETSHASLSPFGWGEICYRDFEIFLTKSMLIKPNMDHINTWPNYYVNNETYLNFNWNFDNFEEVINKVEDLKYCENIATNGHNRFMSYFTNEGKNEFFNHFKKIIKKLI